MYCCRLFQRGSTSAAEELARDPSHSQVSRPSPPEWKLQASGNCRVSHKDTHFACASESPNPALKLQPAFPGLLVRGPSDRHHILDTLA